MLPILYTTVALTSSQQISAFASSLLCSFGRSKNDFLEPALGSYVRHLWFGPTSVTAQHDLLYASVAWPVKSMHQILSHCTSLRALAVVNFSFHRLVGIISTSIESVYLGSIHGHLDLASMRCCTRLRSITSMDTYLMNREVQEVVTSPYVRRFRRLHIYPARIAVTFEQLMCVKSAISLEQMQIVCCGETLEGAAQILECYAEKFKEICEDPRVVLVPKSNRSDGHLDEIQALYDDWEAGFGLTS
ncbi:hypothetical protein AcW1_009491 [Taiwanofungus camphoratus]|nr:hypothetical protein AcV5_002605 [Antrodia cinnamomea]KAI0918781.1 hypothetical protein AcV7_006914 [Antrodia cinnamomea]KAI0947831.1 hypothetical protein AcW1_009491 [Antrodia cinnamomea]